MVEDWPMEGPTDTADVHIGFPIIGPNLKI